MFRVVFKFKVNARVSHVLQPSCKVNAEQARLAFAEPQPMVAVASQLQRQRYEEKRTYANKSSKKTRKKARGARGEKHTEFRLESRYVLA